MMVGAVYLQEVIYGGIDGSTCRRGGLYKLSPPLKWSQLSGELVANGPMKNSACIMVFFNKNKLAVIGGVGSIACLTPAWSIIH